MRSDVAHKIEGITWSNQWEIGVQQMKFQELKLPQKRQEIFFFVTVVSNNSEASDSTTNNTEDKD